MRPAGGFGLVSYEISAKLLPGLQSSEGLSGARGSASIEASPPPEPQHQQVIAERVRAKPQCLL